MSLCLPIPPQEPEEEKRPLTEASVEEIINGMIDHVRLKPDRVHEEQKVEENSKAAREKTEILRVSWNAPKRHRETEVERSGQWGNKLQLIEESLRSGRMWALTGTRGNGKTQLAVEVMKTATRRGQSAMYSQTMEFFMDIKATYNNQDGGLGAKRVIEQYCAPRLLVLDEIGKRGETEWESNLLFHLLDKRYEGKVDTILIANFSPEDLGKSLGASIVGRLNETGGVIHCDWPSRRGE